MNMNRSFNRFANLLIFGLAVGISVSGCGGGGGADGTGGGNAAFSYIADQQGGGFVASWWYDVNASSVAKADVSTLIPSGTIQYNANHTRKILSKSATWGTDPSPGVYYDLIPSGWFAGSDTGSLAISGGNNISYTPTGEPGFTATVTRTDLANTPIVCTNPNTGSITTCAVPANYPAGSASYQLTMSTTSNQFMLYGTGIASPVTDSSGAPLTALPALNTTFCDPGFHYVYQAQGSYSYKVLPTAGCASGDIATAIAAAAPAGTVVINSQATGNMTVTSVLRVVSATGSSSATSLVNMIFGERAGSVWYGWMRPAGTIPLDPEMNKTATNAQLVAHGLPALP